MGFQVSQWLQRRGDLETVIRHLPELVDEGGGNFPQLTQPISLLILLL